MILRYYQREAVDSVWYYFQDNSGNPVIALPGGTGKSLVIAGLLKAIYNVYPNQRIMMLTHVKELIDQNFDKLMKIWPAAPAGIYSAGIGRKDTNCKITYGGIQSVQNKPELFGHIDLIFIDEAHLVSPSQTTSYRKFFKALMKVNPALKIIGLTATPFRLGQGMITEGKNRLFTDICYDGCSLEAFNKLLEEGYLSRLIPKRTSYEIDVSSVKLVAGEFNNKQLQAVTDREEITYRALCEAMEMGVNRKHWLVFSTGVEHCDHIAAQLNTLGISAVSVHSKAPNRDALLEDFKAGRVQCAVNNNILTTGFDYPEIDFIVVLRPTNSPGLWVQMLSRGTRPVYGPGFDLSTSEGRLSAIASGPKPNCLVADFAGNTKRLGPINDPVIPRKKGKKGGGVAPVRLCPECNTYLHASIRICTECGYEFPIGVKFGFTAGKDELIADARDEPQVEVFKVDRVTYAPHSKKDTPISIKATYHCGLRRFTEYICVEHGGFPAKKARTWWRAHRPMDPRENVPLTTQEAMNRLTTLIEPTHIRVWINQKYPKIMKYNFTGGFDVGE